MSNPNPSPDTRFQTGSGGNPGGSSRKARFTQALIRLIEERALEDPFVKAGMDAALAGDFHFWKHIFDRIDGQLLKTAVDAIDIDAVVSEVRDRAEKRRLERELLDRRIKIADKALEGPADRVDLETIAREMVAKRDRIQQPSPIGSPVPTPAHPLRGPGPPARAGSTTPASPARRAGCLGRHLG